MTSAISLSFVLSSSPCISKFLSEAEPNMQLHIFKKKNASVQLSGLKQSFAKLSRKKKVNLKIFGVSRIQLPKLQPLTIKAVFA